MILRLFGKCFPAALGLSALVAAAPASLAQQLAYRATFSNDTGAPQPLQPYRWSLIGGGGALGLAAVDPQLSRRVLDEYAAHSPHGVSLAEGVLRISTTAVPRTALAVTDAPAIQISADSLHGMAWEWTGGNSRAYLARPVVKINSRWFVASCPAYLTVNAPSFAAASVRAEYLFPVPGTPAWKPLPHPLPAEDSATLRAAPVALAGYVEEIGLWFRFGGSPGTIHLDNFEVTVRRE